LPIATPPNAEAEHRQREGQRGAPRVDAEIGLHHRQRDHHRPHADAADGAEQQRRSSRCT
jgi:hypothetical protein